MLLSRAAPTTAVPSAPDTLPSCSPLPTQAFAVASHASQVHFQSLHGGTHFPPLLPRLYSASPPALPCPATVPPPSKPDLVGAQGVTVAGWHEVRLLAPSAELRVAVAGYSRLLDVPRVGYA